MEGYFLTRGHNLRSTRFYRGDAPPAASDFDWLVIMGGPMGVSDTAVHPWLAAEKELIRQAAQGGKLVLGVCLGAQLLAEALGAAVSKGAKEIGWFPVTPSPEAAGSPFAPAFSAPADVFHWHADTFAIPPGAIRLASSAACENQAFCAGSRILGLQFHCEILPDALYGMLTAFRSQLDGSPCVQAEGEMLGNPARFEAANKRLEQMLDIMAASA